MTNHIHLLATPETNERISRMMQDLGRHYVRYFNHTYRRSGTLWEGRFKSCVIDAEDYLLHCQRYIELNSVRANMVNDPADYPWSSYHANGLGKPIKLWTPHEIYLRLGKTQSERLSRYRGLFNLHMDGPTIKAIRDSVNTGMALGNDRFKREIEQLPGRRVTPCRRGPKPAEPSEDNDPLEFLL